MTQSASLSFSKLSLSTQVLRALEEEGYVEPTPIQVQAIPPALEGRDILGCAQTGTGKTAAFAIPILERLLNKNTKGERLSARSPRALILAPTRELAAQITDSFVNYGRYTGLRAAAVFGGVSQYHQVSALQRGVDVLVATPGRLLDLIEQRMLTLSRVEVFVLDEVDRMLDMGFINPIREIESMISPGRQTLLFSATMPNEILKLANSFLRDPIEVSVEPPYDTKKLIRQEVHYVPRAQKHGLLEQLLSEESVERSLVFAKTKRGADNLCKRLRAGGFAAESIHGDKAQSQRMRALDSFKSGRSSVLVATDVAARGIDVDGITHVFNYDIPNMPEAYVHRIGRTGRAGAEGVAIALCDPGERAFFREIEQVLGFRVPVAKGVIAKPASRSTGDMGHSGGHGREDRSPRRGNYNDRQGRGEPANPWNVKNDFVAPFTDPMAESLEALPGESDDQHDAGSPASAPGHYVSPYAAPNARPNRGGIKHGPDDLWNRNKFHKKTEGSDGHFKQRGHVTHPFDRNAPAPARERGGEFHPGRKMQHSEQAPGSRDHYGSNAGPGAAQSRNRTGPVSAGIARDGASKFKGAKFNKFKKSGSGNFTPKKGGGHPFFGGKKKRHQ